MSKKHFKKNGHKSAINHSESKVYTDFLNYKTIFPTLPISEYEIKCYMVLYYMYGVRTEFIVKDFKQRTGITLERELVHKSLKIIRAIDDLLMAFKLSDGLEGSTLKYMYTIESCKDEQVCEYCEQFQLKEFDVKEAVIGENYPPFNKCTCNYCRCFAVFNLR